MGKHRLSTEDLRLQFLRALQNDCYRKNNQLAQELSVDISTLSRLRQSLKNDGYIKFFKAILDPDKFGFTTSSIIEIALCGSRAQEKALIDTLGRNKNVLEIHNLRGSFDILIKVRFKSNSELSNFVDKNISNKKCVRDFNVSIIMNTVKEKTDLPI